MEKTRAEKDEIITYPVPTLCCAVRAFIHVVVDLGLEVEPVVVFGAPGEPLLISLGIPEVRTGAARSTIYIAKMPSGTTRAEFEAEWNLEQACWSLLDPDAQQARSEVIVSAALRGEIRDLLLRAGHKLKPVLH